MKSPITLACFVAFLALTAVSIESAQGTDKQSKAAAFALAGTQYFHRFSKDDLNEYTPAGQEDLKTWVDMVTINYYRKAKDGDALAATANSVLGIYKANRAVVVKTDSVPRTAERTAEHLIVVIFIRPEFREAVFARFKLHEGIGTGVIYSHRIYGKEVGNQMSAWLKQNGPATEKALMQWNAMPKTAGATLRP